MRVISIIEPWASLIKEKIKYIETRSWQTKYRGELYIHASQKKLTRKNWMEYRNEIRLLQDTDFKYGHIIAKCNLVDCKVMTDEFIDIIKTNHNEYLCGNYQNGRYAWILEDIEMLESPIPAKGQLGIWKYENEQIYSSI